MVKEDNMKYKVGDKVVCTGGGDEYPVRKVGIIKEILGDEYLVNRLAKVERYNTED